MEVCYSCMWGTVCDNGWTDKNAQVVCRQLGFKGQGKANKTTYMYHGGLRVICGAMATVCRNVPSLFFPSTALMLLPLFELGV